MHDYKDLDEVYNNIICEMEELIEKFETNLKFITNERDQLENKLADGDKNFQETRNIILQTEKDMKEAISNHASNLLQDLDAKWKLSENMIKIELSALKQNVDELEIRKNNLCQALQTHQVTELFSTTQTLDKSVPIYLVKQFKQCKTKFIPNSRQVKMGSNILGDLYSVPDFEVIKHYQSKNKSVTNITFCEDDTAFIASFASSKLQKVKFDNDRIKVETDIKIIVNDMEKTQDGELLVSYGEGDILLYTKDGTLKTFMTFTPLRTLGIHLTKNGKIIVGLSDSLEVIATETSIRRLVVMNLNGDIQYTIEYDKDNQRLLSCPYKIKTLNDKIVVVELSNIKKAGKVIMLDYCGLLHWTYNGCTRINSDQDKFNPRDLAITSSDMILVSDYMNHAIHVINQTGEIIVCKDVRSLGIEYPISLHIDKHEVLWIGEVSKKETMKAEISCVRLS
ncbi:uncharacterized protein LOC134727647 [Mytilus trossulus]|uniref:uncharacterized protein LOC134727647 n=1 Tax=Mytilus trossulus TaxID=6551 RepID=UPI003006671D